MTQELIAQSKASKNDALIKARMRTEIGKEMEKTGVVPFTLDNDVKVIEERTKLVADTRDLGDAELSYLLFTLREARTWANAGHPNFVTYCDAVLGIDKRRATTAANSWDMFLSLSLSPTVLGGEHRISWAKFRALRPAVNCQKITSANIYEYLPLIADTGPESMLLKDIESMVKALVAQAASGDGEDDDDRIFLKIGVSKSSVAAIHQYQEVISKSMGIDDAGRQVLKALEYLSASICGNDMEAAKLTGLLGLKRAAESMVPGIRCVFVLDGKTALSEHDLGITPVTRLFQGFSEGENGKTLVHVLASSEAEAKQMLNVAQVREFPIRLSDSVSGEAAAAPEAAPVTARGVTVRGTDVVASIKAMAKNLVSLGVITKDEYWAKAEEFKNTEPGEKERLGKMEAWLAAKFPESEELEEGE
jgi:hypothetical protein